MWRTDREWLALTCPVRKRRRTRGDSWSWAESDVESDDWLLTDGLYASHALSRTHGRSAHSRTRIFPPPHFLREQTNLKTSWRCHKAKAAVCLSLIPVEERGNEILWKKKKITWDTSICPKAVCLPHLAAGEYTVRKELCAIPETFKCGSVVEKHSCRIFWGGD